MLRYRLKSTVHPVINQRTGICDCICGCWKRRRQVHPDQSTTAANHEMVAVHGRRYLRVIHNRAVKKQKIRQSKNKINHDAGTSKPGTDLSQVSRVNGTCTTVTAETYLHADTSDDSDSSDESSLKRVYGFELDQNHCGDNTYSSSNSKIISAFAHRLVLIALEDALNDLQALQKIMFPEQDCGNGNGNLLSNANSSNSWDFESNVKNNTRGKSDCCASRGELYGVENLGFRHSQSDMETINSMMRSGRPWNTCNIFGCQCLDSEEKLAASVPVCRNGHNQDNEYPKRKRFHWNGVMDSQTDYGNVTTAVDLETSTCQLTISSDDGSSCHGSTWGSSTDGSLRFVRKLVAKKYDTKPLLFFIHGIGGSADMWKAQLSFFSKRGYETVAMDLVGHGFSSAPDDPKVYNFHSILADMIVLFDRYCKERNVVIGHAYGSSFATALAQQRSRLVSQLVLLSGGGPLPLCQHSISAGLPLCFLSCLGPLVKCGFKRDAFYSPSGRQPKVMEGLDLPLYVIQYLTKGQVWPEGDIVFHKQITVPTLLVYGMKDPFVTLVEECEMERTIPRAFLELIPEAGHLLMVDVPDKLNDMVYKFLRRWDC